MHVRYILASACLRYMQVYQYPLIYATYGLTSIPSWVSNYIDYNVWDEITYQFLNFNGATVEVWEEISNFIPHFNWYVITR